MTTSSLNFINVLRTAFTHVRPQKCKKILMTWLSFLRFWAPQVVSHFTLFGSARAKAVHKHVGEIDPKLTAIDSRFTNYDAFFGRKISRSFLSRSFLQIEGLSCKFHSHSITYQFTKKRRKARSFAVW